MMLSFGLSADGAIPVKAVCFKCRNDGFGRAIDTSGLIYVINAKQPGSVMVSGVSVAGDCRYQRSEMQFAGRGRRKTSDVP